MCKFISIYLKMYTYAFKHNLQKADSEPIMDGVGPTKYQYSTGYCPCSWLQSRT